MSEHVFVCSLVTIAFSFLLSYTLPSSFAPTQTLCPLYENKSHTLSDWVTYRIFRFWSCIRGVGNIEGLFETGSCQNGRQLRIHHLFFIFLRMKPSKCIQQEKYYLEVAIFSIY